MIETRAPGKLFIAGEYAVVEPGQPAVLIAVDRCITVRLTESEGAGRIHSSEYGQAPVVWRREDDGEHIIVDERPFDYVLSAISTVEELRSGRGASPATSISRSPANSMTQTAGSSASAPRRR